MIDNEIESKMSFYAELYGEAWERVSDNAAACLIVQQIGEDLRQAKINGGRDSAVKRVINGDAEPTEKQLSLLKKLGVRTFPGMNRAEASEKIDEARQRKATYVG